MDMLLTSGIPTSEAEKRALPVKDGSVRSFKTTSILLFPGEVIFA